MNSIITTLVLVLLAGAGVDAAEPTTTGPSPGIVLAPPVAALPTPPADGSGCYRLTLSGWDGHRDPVLVYLDVRGGKVTAAIGRGFALFDESSLLVDASGLAMTGGRLRGKLTVVLPGLRPWGEYEQKIVDPRNPSPLDPPARGSLTADLDLPTDRPRHEGTCRGALVMAARDRQPEKRTEIDFVVRLVRESFPPYGEQLQVSLYIPFALGPTYIFPQVAVSAEMTRGKSSRIVANWAVNHYHHHDRLAIPVNGELLLADGRLTGRIELRPVLNAEESEPRDGPPRALEPVTLDIAGTMAGRWVAGSAAVKNKDRSWRSACLGRWRGEGWPIPLEIPKAKWTWQHDLPSDPALVAEAQREAQAPVLEGVPGERGFWTWRKLLWPGAAVHSIRPVNFDFREVAGAAKYRFSATIKGGSVKSVILDKPWKPLTDLWSELPVGVPCRLSFETLDAQGKVLGTTLKMGVIGKESAQREEKELTSVEVLRKAPFQGPYAKAPRSLREAALKAGRWASEGPAYPAFMGVQFDGYPSPLKNGGEKASSIYYASSISGLLAQRALCPAAPERACAEETVDILLDALAVNQACAKPDGVFYAYKGSTPLARYGGESALDAWLELGDERSRQMAMKLAAGLTAVQAPDGGWPVTGWGYFGWKQGFKQWSSAEVLYILGRVRRDCRTEQFRDTEDRAFRYVMDRQVKEMFWPASDTHSFTWAYPVALHAQSAIYFIRYLLELAPPDRRDVALAEKLALWCEDLNVDWGRRDGPQEGAIVPRVNRGDRNVLSPSNNTTLLALVCLQLHRATGKRQWLAKADALITACLQAQDPASGVVNVNLQSEFLKSGDFFGWYARNLLEYERLRTGIQPAFAVRGEKP
jgi:hypothetical protein